MHFPIVVRVLGLAILEPVAFQNLFFAGALRTEPGISSCMQGLAPVATFFLAVVLRIEKLRLHSSIGKIKLLGALLMIGGAVLMVLQVAPFSLPGSHPPSKVSSESKVEGVVFLLLAVVTGAGYNLLLGNTLSQYPHPLVLVACSNTIGAVLDLCVGLVLGHGFNEQWIILWDVVLATYFYGGVVVSSLSFWLVGRLVESRGAVFVSAFSPLSMVLVQLVSVIILKRISFITSAVGLSLIVTGLGIFLWGKSKDEKKRVAVEENP